MNAEDLGISRCMGEKVGRSFALCHRARLTPVPKYNFVNGILTTNYTAIFLRSNLFVLYNAAFHVESRLKRF